ncbi:MAG: zinc ribbon domain-containing protein, partial [Gammaproteobacteria bacterium]|nr:zinc ribbon domain-containing protein [Gammaproteobacteria bacterium]
TGDKKKNLAGDGKSSDTKTTTSKKTESAA